VAVCWVSRSERMAAFRATWLARRLASGHTRFRYGLEIVEVPSRSTYLVFIARTQRHAELHSVKCAVSGRKRSGLIYCRIPGCPLAGGPALIFYPADFER